MSSDAGFDPLNARPYRAEDIEQHPDNSHARVARMVGRDARVLELGCATGFLTEVLVRQGCRVVAVEIDPTGAAFAAGYADHVIVADLDTLDLAAELPDQRFDIVVAADVLEHTRNPGRVLSEAMRVLDADGAVVVSIPNVAHAAVRLALLAGEFPYADIGLLDRTHLHFYTVASATDLLVSCGLEIVAVERVTKAIADALIPFDHDKLPPGVEEWAAAQPEALTYQFVFRCRPITHARNASAPASAAATDVWIPDDILQFQARAMLEMDGAIQNLRAENVALAAETATLSRKITNLTTRMETLSERNATLRARTTELGEERKRLSAEKRTLTMEKAALERRLAVQDAGLTAARSAIRTFQQSRAVRLATAVRRLESRILRRSAR